RARRLNVRSHANNLIWLASNEEQLSESGTARPEAPREGFVDDCDRRPCRVVLLAKSATFENRHPQRRKKCGINVLNEHLQRGCLSCAHWAHREFMPVLRVPHQAFAAFHKS